MMYIVKIIEILLNVNFPYIIISKLNIQHANHNDFVKKSYFNFDISFDES